MLKESLIIPEHLDILYVLTLGKPKEVVLIEELGEDIKYWRDKAEIEKFHPLK